MNTKAIAGAGRIERRKEETKQRIVTVAMDLIRKHGFDGTTMEQIAEEVDIAKGTLYNYFPVKEAILNEYIHQSFREKNPKRIGQLRELPNTRSRMFHVLNELMEGIRAQREIFERYLTYQIQNMLSLKRGDGVKSGFNQLGAEIVRLGQKNGELRSDLPFEILTALFDFTFVEVAQQFYMDPEHFKAEETIGQCIDLFMNGAKRIEDWTNQE